jgi:hypothetical protein
MPDMHKISFAIPRDLRRDLNPTVPPVRRFSSSELEPEATQSLPTRPKVLKGLRGVAFGVLAGRFCWSLRTKGGQIRTREASWLYQETLG